MLSRKRLECEIYSVTMYEGVARVGRMTRRSTGAEVHSRTGADRNRAHLQFHDTMSGSGISVVPLRTAIVTSGKPFLSVLPQPGYHVRTAALVKLLVHDVVRQVVYHVHGLRRHLSGSQREPNESIL
jgi:hypothetical protein